MHHHSHTAANRASDEGTKTPKSFREALERMVEEKFLRTR